MMNAVLNVGKPCLRCALKATANTKSRSQKTLGNAIRITYHFLANFHKQSSKTFSSLKIFSFFNPVRTIKVNMEIKMQLENVKHLGRAWKEESMHEIPVKLLRQDTHTFRHTHIQTHTHSDTHTFRHTHTHLVNGMLWLSKNKIHRRVHHAQ